MSAVQRTRTAADRAGHRRRRSLALLSDGLWTTISAYCLTLSYLSPRFAVLAWVALVPLFVVLRRVGGRATVGHGLLWGVVFFGFGGTVRAGCLTIAVLESAVTGALCFAVAAIAVNRITHKLGFNPIVLGLIWLIYEVARSIVFPNWETLAASQPLGGAALDLIALTGSSGLSFLIVLVNVLLIRLWEWVRANLDKRSDHGWHKRPILISRPRIVRVPKSCYVLPETRGPPLAGTDIGRIVGPAFAAS